MLEWKLEFKPHKKNQKRFIPIAGSSLSRSLRPIGYSTDDLLIANLTFFRGPSYYEWYSRVRNKIYNINITGEWRVVFYHIDAEGKATEHYYNPILMVENVSFNHNNESSITRFVNYSEYWLNRELDITINYNNKVSLQTLLNDIVTKFINLKDNNTKYVPHVNIWDKTDDACELGKFIDHFTWKGNGLDMLHRLSERYGLELLFYSDLIYIGKQVFIGEPLERCTKYIPVGDEYRSVVGNIYSNVTTTMAPPPGFGFVCKYGDNDIVSGRNIVVDYYCNMDGATCHTLTLDEHFNITEKEIVEYQRILGSNMIKNRNKVHPQTFIGLNRTNETINSFDYKKIYHEIFPSLRNALPSSVNDTLNFTNFNITGLNTDEPNLRTLRASPFAGNTHFYNVINKPWSKLNTSWGVQYPHLDGDVDIVSLIDGDLDKTVTTGQMWVGDAPYRNSPMDYRLTFVDGSTIYESVENETISIIGRKGVGIYTMPTMKWNSNIYASTTGPFMAISENKVNLGNGSNNYIEIQGDRIILKVGRRTVTIDGQTVNVT